MRYAKITRTLEDGTIEETLVELPEKVLVKSKTPTKRKSSRKSTNEDNEKQEKVKTTSISKASIKIT
jgi:hypothetical protein